MLDVVCTQSDLPAPTVDTVDVGMSESPSATLDDDVITSTTGLRHVYRSSLAIIQPRWVPGRSPASALCDDQKYQELDGDSLVQLNDTTITRLLDRQVANEIKTCHRWPSNGGLMTTAGRLNDYYARTNVVW